MNKSTDLQQLANRKLTMSFLNSPRSVPQLKKSYRGDRDHPCGKNELGICQHAKGKPKLPTRSNARQLGLPKEHVWCIRQSTNNRKTSGPQRESGLDSNSRASTAQVAAQELIRNIDEITNEINEIRLQQTQMLTNGPRTSKLIFMLGNRKPFILFIY